LVEQYLRPSETFIYTTLTALRRCQPVIISYGEVIDLDNFPPAGMPLYSLHERLRKAKYFGRRVRAKLTREAWTKRAHREELEQIAKEQPPDLLHAHFGPTGYLGLSVKRALGVPLITTFYGYDTISVPHDRKWAAQRQKLLAEGDLFLAEGPFMQSALIQLGCAAARVRLQPIAVDLTRIPAKQQRDPAAPPVILFAGRFVEKKGIEYGLRAISKLHHSGTKLECRIIGFGPLENRLRRFVATRGLDKVTSFLGRLTYAQYLDELSKADIFVQPSVVAKDGDLEGGAPTTLLEAQACGLPVVTTAHADIPNVVVAGESAIVVPERDSEALADALAQLLSRPQDWPVMGKKGRAFVEEHHSSVRAAERLEALYRECASGAHSRVVSR
jgi:colanic acid/amylovoran biosynthesis glycosyltransferase